jgi:hypothetical protein
MIFVSSRCNPGIYMETRRKSTENLEPYSRYSGRDYNTGSLDSESDVLPTELSYLVNFKQCILYNHIIIIYMKHLTMLQMNILIFHEFYIWAEDGKLYIHSSELSQSSQRALVDQEFCRNLIASDYLWKNSGWFLSCPFTIRVTEIDMIKAKSIPGKETTSWDSEKYIVWSIISHTDSEMGYFSLHSGGLNNRNSIPVRGKRFFSTASRPVLWPTQPPSQWLLEFFLQGVKRTGREADHLPSSSAEVKNGGLHLHSPYVFVAWCLID